MWWLRFLWVGWLFALVPGRVGAVPDAASGADSRLAAAPPEDCTSVLEPIRAELRLPSLAAAVVYQGRLVAVGATGVRRAGGQSRVTPEDRYHMGSLTKSMTATLAGRLVAQGKIRWDTTLAEVFPDRADRLDPGYRNVTLEQLLAHRAGVPAALDEGGLWSRLWKRSEPPRLQRLYLLDQVTRRPPVAPPGTRFLYSNAGYAIAGAMLEQVADRPWEDLMRKEIFEPLGMRSAGFGPPARPGEEDQPWGHVPDGKRYRPIPPGPGADNPPAIAPAGAVHGSLPDLARYVQCHLRGARGEACLVPPEVFARLHRPAGDETHALGWVVVSRDWAGGKALTHAGSNTTFFAVIWMAPARDFAVMVASNAGGPGAERGCDRAAWELIRRHLLKTEPERP